MEQNSQSPELRAFELIRQAAYEYNKSEFKFFQNGFFKYKREGDHTFLIEDIYIVPEFRGTPVAHMILSDFEDFMRHEGILMYYGRVFKGSNSYDKRIKTFTKWGMSQLDTNPLYTLVTKQVEYYDETE